MKDILYLAYANLLESIRKVLMLSDLTMKLLFMPGFNRFRHFNAAVRAYAEFLRAKRNIPAYRDFLESKGFDTPSFSGLTPNIHEIPFTSKDNYVKLYSIDDRCVHGQVPEEEVVIDESSGSTGTATNWVRGEKERAVNARFIQFGMRNLFGNAPLFIINAFALGPWATGINVTMTCLKFSKLKSLGPDRVKIENTLKQFGTGHKYVIMGYPPFLKMLVDEAQIQWKDYDISFILGGESMTEGMRAYFQQKGIRQVYSSFGASDLELNMSAENEFTIRLRNLLRTNAVLRQHLLKYPGALPMVFQYNPTDFFIETNDAGEMLITICRPDYIAQKIRYNIQDKGQIIQMSALKELLKSLQIPESAVFPAQTDLPILLHYGRADMTVSYFGSNISAVDIQEALYNMPELAENVSSYSISAAEDHEGNKQLEVSMEYKNTFEGSMEPTEQVRAQFFKELTMVNQDFREALRMAGINARTYLRFFRHGEGPFADNDIRIKARYIVQQPLPKAA
jgi:phenylacetate-CoA ligase